MIVKYMSGLWRSNPHWGPTDGAGDSRYIAGKTYLRPGFPEGSLIGKVGGNNSGGGGKTFHIGNLGSVPSGLEGILWLTVNDEIGPGKGFGDNSGSIIVHIDLQ